MKFKNDQEKELYRRLWTAYIKDWNRYARDVLNVKLDKDQQEILAAVQQHNKISVRSGNARGKDFVAAVASICFLNLNRPSKVIETAPTGRQVTAIMMSEIQRIYAKVRSENRVFVYGSLLSSQIKMADPEWYLLGFKAQDKAIESWTGFHSPNLMMVVTEASGIEDATFDAIESILTGNSKLLIVFNPNRMTGEAWKSVKDPSYVKFKLNCLNAPNVLAKKTVIPGQVDYGWVKDKVDKWCMVIDASQVSETEYDFQFDGQWHRPNDLFLVKVMGEFPREGENKLIPLNWIEAAQNRWKEWQLSGQPLADELRLGVDVAGQGRDMTVFCFRRGMVVEKFQFFSRLDHMETAGRVKNLLDANINSQAFVDTIGEGAGVHSRLVELGSKSISTKFSEGAKDLHDYTSQNSFANMRAYCYWAIRDALDPKYGSMLALPPNDELSQDLNEPIWKRRSDGTILIEEKEEIKKRLGRSPDFGDALALTFYPKKSFEWRSVFGETNYFTPKGWGVNPTD